MKIALAQINTKVGDVPGNLAKALEWYLKAEQAGCDLVVFPELTISGYPPEDLLFREFFLDACEEAIQMFAKHTGKCAALIGAPWAVDDGDPTAFLPNNSAILCQFGNEVQVYNKLELPNYAVFDEERYFSNGEEVQPLFKINDMWVGVSVCEDIWRDFVPEFQASHGARLLVNLSASPYSALRIDDRENLLRSLAIKHNVPIVYVNLVGGQDELVFDGGSMAISHKGVVAARAKQFEEDLLIFDTDEKVQEINPKMTHLEEVYTALVTGTRDYVHKVGCEKVILGLSGGIDSALVAAVAVDALGPDNVTGILMPSEYSSEGSLLDARKLAENLGIQTRVVPIEVAHNTMRSLLEVTYETLGYTAETNADENVQARLRGLILMALSNQGGALVLTTGNKSEMAMGYATLYGDMAGGFGVIKDVPKTLVFALCRWLNERMADAPLSSPIPQSIIDKPPSAELKPDQLDSDTLPDYETLDQIIHLYVNEDLSPEDILTQTGFEQVVVERVVQAIDRNEYKRRQAPPGVRISMKAFGRDRRLPISNGWRYS